MSTDFELLFRPIYAVIFNIMNRGEALTDEVKILSNVRDNVYPENEWLISNHERTAAENILNYANRIAALANIKYKPPKLTIRKTFRCNPNINRKVWIENKIQYQIGGANRKHLVWIFSQIYGFKNFRPGQYKIIKNILNGNSTIGILPTGSGKSVIYQLATILQPKLAIIITPTVALIEDQARTLNERFGITSTAVITGSKNEQTKLESLNSQFNFIAPERLELERFRSTLKRLNFLGAISTIIFDEVHCLSEWGHDFRISYLRATNILSAQLNQPTYLGLTATASANVVQDIAANFHITNSKNIIFNSRLHRENISFEFKTFRNEQIMKEELCEAIASGETDLCGDKTKAILIFVKTHTQAKKLSDFLQQDRRLSGKVAYYFSTSGYMKKVVDYYSNGFMNNKYLVMIATKAFGMGIDKPNIYQTFHYGIPASIESFYQEAGRAGRDPNIQAKSYVYTFKYPLLSSYYIKQFFQPNQPAEKLKFIAKQTELKPTDIATNFHFLTANMKTKVETKTSLLKLYDILKTNSKRNKVLLTITADQFSKIETNLYYLSLAKVVSDWTVSHSGQKIIYRVELTNQKPENVESIFDQIYDHDFNYFTRSRIKDLNLIYEMVAKKFKNGKHSNQIATEIDHYFDITEAIKNIKNTPGT